MLDLTKMNYNVKEDIELYNHCDYFNNDELLKRTKLNKNTLYKIIQDNLFVDEINEKIYTYFYDNKYNINYVKSSFLLNNSNNKILFHGSKYGLKMVTIDGSRNKCDFGSGFYLGESYIQASSFIYENEQSSVYSFECNLEDLKILNFKSSKEWLIAICYYRGTINKYSNSKIVQDIIKQIEQSDIIIAPIADNKMFNIMNLFASGDINIDVTVKALEASNLGLQYVFKTQKAIDKLIPIDRYYICDKERIDIRNKVIDRSSKVDNILKEALRLYRNGLFIEEVLK